jgi:hypothetical protein
MKKLLLLSLTMSLLFACQKEAGEGGTSTIKGKIITYELNHFDVPGGNQTVDTLSSYYTADKEVYIIYGDEGNFYDDSYETSWDGSFRFEYLRKGKYTIFVYSNCESDTSGLAALQQTNPTYAQELETTIWQVDCIDGEFPLKIEVEITDNNTEYNLSDLSIYKIASN